MNHAGIATRRPASTPTPSITTANFRYPSWMSTDGEEIWNYSQTFVARTLDEGASWTTINTFDHPVNGVRQYDGGAYDGELLVSIYPPSAPGELWRSVGYDRGDPTSAGWEKVLDASVTGAYFSGEWCVWVDGDLVFAAEYGTKTAPDNARYVYRSTDGGDNWDTIFDWQGSGRHVHGVAYDRWWDCVWVVLGDDQQGIVYSTDWRSDSPSWTWVSDTLQPVGVLPMPEAVVFGTDDGNNGIITIPRGPNSAQDVSVVRAPAYRLTTDATLTLLTTSLFWLGEGHPALFSFAAVPGQTKSGVVVGSWDGLTFHRLFTDTATYTGKGAMRIVGPTAEGNYVGSLSDDRQSSMSRLTLPAPEWDSVVL